MQAPRELCECRLRQLAGHTPDEIAAQMSVSRTTAFRALTGAPEIARRYIHFGASPRAAQAMIELARVRALNQGRYNVAYEDIRFVAPACLRHRLALNFDALADGVSVEQVIKTLMEEVEKRHAQ